MDTKAEIIKLAEKLIRTRGYHGFSYKDISTRLNIKNAAIHYHFATKSDLGEAVIETIGTRQEQAFEDWAAKTPTEKLSLFMNIYQQSATDNMVCFIGALGPSATTLPLNMQQKLTEKAEIIRVWLREVLNDGIQKTEFHFKEDAKNKADLIISSLLAALILNQITKEDMLNNVLQTLKTEVGM